MSEPRERKIGDPDTDFPGRRDPRPDHDLPGRGPRPDNELPGTEDPDAPDQELPIPPEPEVEPPTAPEPK